MTKKQQRELIYNKYDGHCAYCGVELQRGWHIDELEPVRRNYTERYCHIKRKYIRKLVGCIHPERFNLENQMPACASCNINKHSGSLEDFRKLIEGFMKHLNELNTQYKIAKRYNLVIETKEKVVFYFESVGKKNTVNYHEKNKTD